MLLNTTLRFLYYSSSPTKFGCTKRGLTPQLVGTVKIPAQLAYFVCSFLHQQVILSKKSQRSNHNWWSVTDLTIIVRLFLVTLVRNVPRNKLRFAILWPNRHFALEHSLARKSAVV